MGGYNTSSPFMTFRFVAFVAFVSLAQTTAASAAADATLFRVFLRDGASLVSYGEFARVGDQVVFSMPVGGGPTSRGCTWCRFRLRRSIGSARSGTRRQRGPSVMRRPAASRISNGSATTLHVSSTKWRWRPTRMPHWVQRIGASNAGGLADHALRLSRA